MSLHDHYDPNRTGGEGNWMGPGWHDSKVTEFKVGESDVKKTPYVEFTLASLTGQTGTVSFYLTPDAMFRLAGFAKACGLSDQAMRIYDPESRNAHNMLRNKRVLVFIPDGGKSWDIKQWKASDVEAAHQASVAPAADTPEGDDIPF